MGAAASRELEMAQGQVKRLTRDIQRIGSSLQLSECKLGAVQREALALQSTKDELKLAQQELNATSADLIKARREARELPRVVQKLAVSQQFYHKLLRVGFLIIYGRLYHQNNRHLHNKLLLYQ